MQEEEHRCGVGRGDHGANQKAFDPAQPQQPMCRAAGQRGGDRHTDRGQDERRAGRDSKIGGIGAQAAVEQDDGKRDAADYVGCEVVVEIDAARAVLAEEHAERQERQQQGRPDPRRDQTDEDAEEQEKRPQQDQLVGKLHCVLSARAAATFGSYRERAVTDRVERCFSASIHVSWRGAPPER
jgi:hypothetical protein